MQGQVRDVRQDPVLRHARVQLVSRTVMTLQDSDNPHRILGLVLDALATHLGRYSWRR